MEFYNFGARPPVIIDLKTGYGSGRGRSPDSLRAFLFDSPLTDEQFKTWYATNYPTDEAARAAAWKAIGGDPLNRSGWDAKKQHTASPENALKWFREYKAKGSDQDWFLAKLYNTAHTSSLNASNYKGASASLGDSNQSVGKPQGGGGFFGDFGSMLGDFVSSPTGSAILKIGALVSTGMSLAGTSLVSTATTFPAVDYSLVANGVPSLSTYGAAGLAGAGVPSLSVYGANGLAGALAVSGGAPLGALVGSSGGLSGSAMTSTTIAQDVKQLNKTISQVRKVESIISPPKTAPIKKATTMKQLTSAMPSPNFGGGATENAQQRAAPANLGGVNPASIEAAKPNSQGVFLLGAVLVATFLFGGKS